MKIVGLYSTVILLLACMVLGSCEKVIDIDLDPAEKKFVIEAVITDRPGTAKVMITQTLDFDQTNNFPGITGATVSVTEVGGATTLFVPGPSNTYIAPGLVAVSGKTYNLSVTINGSVFTAECTMSPKVALDSLFVTEEFLFTDNRKIANIVYQDPLGRGNNYRFVQYVNNIKESQIMIANDDYTDGRTVTNKLFFFAEDDDPGLISTGDSVRVDMQCIDPDIYKYWYSLDRSSTGGSGQATPSNPVTNMRGGALGYFSAHTLESRVIAAP